MIISRKIKMIVTITLSRINKKGIQDFFLPPTSRHERKNTINNKKVRVRVRERTNGR